MQTVISNHNDQREALEDQVRQKITTSIQLAEQIAESKLQEFRDASQMQIFDALIALYQGQIDTNAAPLTQANSDLTEKLAAVAAKVSEITDQENALTTCYSQKFNLNDSFVTATLEKTRQTHLHTFFINRKNKIVDGCDECKAKQTADIAEAVSFFKLFFLN